MSCLGLAFGIPGITWAATSMNHLQVTHLQGCPWSCFELFGVCFQHHRHHLRCWVGCGHGWARGRGRGGAVRFYAVRSVQQCQFSSKLEFVCQPASEPSTGSAKPVGFRAPNGSCQSRPDVVDCSNVTMICDTDGYSLKSLRALQELTPKWVWGTHVIGNKN